MQCNVMFSYGEIGSLNRLQHYAAFDREGWVVGVAVTASQHYTANKSVGHYPRQVNYVGIIMILQY